MNCNNGTATHRRSVNTVPRFDNLMNEFFNTAIGDVVKKSEKKHFTNPATNVVEHDDKFVLSIALPGYSKKDLIIKVEDYLLKVSDKIADAEQTDEEGPREKFRLREFNYEGFSKSFKLPKTANPQKVSAAVDLGILTIEIPKKKEAIPQPPREIKIK